MSLLVLGLSHHGAPLELLESAALDQSARGRLEGAIVASEHVAEAVVVSTCNRTEVYAEGLTFHGALTDVSEALAEATGVALSDLQPHLYVHYEDRGIAHAFSVASGLDSMAVGEAQILGQLRESLTRAQRRGHVGPALNGLLQQALRVGKRVHAETGIDDVSRSLVGSGLTAATEVVGPLAGARVLVVGAGGMGALAATAASQAGAASVTITNRGAARAERLAVRVDGAAVPWDDRRAALADADIIISSTGATGVIITAEDVAAGATARSGRPQVFIDLALPHDVDLTVSEVAGATRIGLAELGELLSGAGDVLQVREARDIVTGEVAAYLTERSAEAVAPTVAALRSRAQEVVDVEMRRLGRRTPELTDHDRAEVERAVHRIVEKLLHAPTVRVKQLAQDGQGGSYAKALSELFDLDPREVSVVSTPPVLPSSDEEVGR
ncbi:glutamyl-tRNA reductase [Knoellia subterranea]|uniref:Glutamyl-tRNA reductase n=1 Tax=Knoellia subterranea KCTC 19937 TaxID=1385521 RepID=A0A0A0JM20_9MICO|nr:glutamyl-tRNA reductase [Knoellia subterranea]KGN38178.1 glutamyl-tRNA reductase [Knoellia subterranea KCTC 19937]